MREDLAQIAETLLDYAENGETFQTDKITTVPSGVYTDADLWKKEMDGESIISSCFDQSLCLKRG